MPVQDQEFQLIALPSTEGLKLWLAKASEGLTQALKRSVSQLSVSQPSDSQPSAPPPTASRPLHRLPAGATVLATLASEADIPKLRRTLTDHIGPCVSILLDAGCCQTLPELLPQIKTALIKLSRHDTVVSLCDANGVPVEPPPGSPASRQLNELRQAVSALRRMTRLRPQDRLRARWQARSEAATNIAVLGGGIAGVTIALELLRRGKTVRLIEAHEHLLSEASSQPTLACHPQFSRDQDMLSQLSQQALRLTLDSPYADLFVRKGRLSPALSLAHSREQQAQVKHLNLPADMLRYVDAGEATRLAQWPVRTDRLNNPGAPPCAWGGLWTELGASLPIPLLRERVAALAAKEGSGLTVLSGQRVQSVKWRDGCWHLSMPGGPGSLLAQGLIVAAGAGTPGIIQHLCGPGQPFVHSPLPREWEEMGGQTFLSTCPQWNVPEAAPTIGGPVTLQRIDAQTLVVGSSYYEPDAAPPDPTQWQAIQHKLTQLPGTEGLTFEYHGRQPGVRCYTPDRMPLIGPLLDPITHSSLNTESESGSSAAPASASCASLWLASAFGSRGLLWAHLAAQLIADHVDGKAPGIGLKALKSIDALRYLTVPQRNTSPHF